MDTCNFSWVTKDDIPRRVQCRNHYGHSKFHDDGDGHKIPVGMENILAKSPQWETRENYLEFSSSHSSNFGLDSQ